MNLIAVEKTHFPGKGHSKYKYLRQEHGGIVKKQETHIGMKCAEKRS